MRKLIVFNHISLDGYFVDAHNSMMWAKMATDDPDWTDFIAGNVRGEGPLIFGRITYEMMASYWPTPMAKQNDANVAAHMNKVPKIVFSKTLRETPWNNSTLIKTDLLAEIKKRKQEPGEGMAILGSGSIVAQLAAHGLIDEYQVVVNPIALGKGRTMFEGLGKHLSLHLTKSRAFRNGNVFLSYEPKA